MLRVSQNQVYRTILCMQHIRFMRQTHYDTLRLAPTCTPKEIREAFIKLSKKLHPDANVSNSDRKPNEKAFVQLLEAYKVLSREESRANYDFELSLRKRSPGQHSRPWQPNPSHYRKPDPDSYYGIKGVRRVNNWIIVLGCGIFMIIGVTLQAVAIDRSFTFSRKQLDESSRKYATTHAEIRAEA
ncbi:dnaJ-like protein 60 [Toxorhynchites rutilus septentrionalis]|uniref:dnaJ-like protein 60 n=1 Tax=Toxorhynchites rutilus septentrionalis TaxID=329112 RepID=UPI0024796F2C|nr:dnaJ-like protein 60 [Toxorhynchites rutilus septentrionalis]